MFKQILSLLVFLFFISVLTLAAEPASALQIEPIFSENQVPETKGYFDVDVTEGEQINIQLRLRNDAETPINVRIEKTNAYTSPTGGILYEAEIDSEDTLLLDDAIRLVDYMETEDIVTIPALESVDLPIQVTVPETEGQTLLGGIIVTEATGSSQVKREAEEDEATFIINTETAHVFAIKLNFQSNVEPSFSTGKVGFLAPTAQVFLELLNDAQLIQREVEWTYSILNSSGTELFGGEVDAFNMAPKSKIRFPMAWNHETLEDGDYTLVVNGQAGEQQISVKEPFTISTEEVQEYAEVINPTPVVDEGEDGGIPTWVWIVIAISIAIIFGALMFFWGRKKTE